MSCQAYWPGPLRGLQRRWKERPCRGKDLLLVWAGPIVGCTVQLGSRESLTLPLLWAKHTPAVPTKLAQDTLPPGSSPGLVRQPWGLCPPL